MSGTYDVAVKVVSQKGKCYAGHKVGDAERRHGGYSFLMLSLE